MSGTSPARTPDPTSELSAPEVRLAAAYLQQKLSTSQYNRLLKIVELLSELNKANYAAVLQALFPEAPDPQASLRKFREEVNAAAKAAGIVLSIETDGKTRTPANQRAVWFEGNDPTAKEVRRRVAEDVKGTERSPQDAVRLRPLRIFVSYAHDDKALKEDLLRHLKPFLPTENLELWMDNDILMGEAWKGKIEDALQQCHAGLLLLSPHFLGSKFIRKVELPAYVAAAPGQPQPDKILLPVSLVPVIGRVSDLGGLEDYQIFRDSNEKSYSERTAYSTRQRFADQLFQQIRKVLVKHSPSSSPAPPPSGVDDPDDEVETLRDRQRTFIAPNHPTHYTQTQGARTSLDQAKKTTEITGQRGDALEFLHAWLNDPAAPRYCALLGEYGMGKTTTVRQLTLDLLENPAAPRTPIYLDLRAVGDLAKQEPKLEAILERCVNHAWKAGLSDDLNPRRIDALVKKGALVIWDGLDEVLVHLTTQQGQRFTQELLRILPPQSEESQGRLILTCRTEYFPTLQAQKSHFLMQGRERIKTADYEAFVLLPFTKEQVKDYVAHTLPGDDPDRVMEVIASVHNLTELAERPYTLSLIVDQIAGIERMKAAGARVTGVTLYGLMVDAWLVRDDGKHQWTAEHKRMLIEHFAAALWRSGKRSWSVYDVEQWLIDFLTANPRIAGHYEGKDRELLKQDLRTATFLVREGDTAFRFAHTSLQEYFLAGYLRRALVEGHVERVAMPRPNRETLDFLGQWLLETPAAELDRALSSLKGIRGAYVREASELAFDYLLRAEERDYPKVSLAGFDLPGVDLRDREITGRPGTLLNLTGINLQGARLAQSRWRRCRMNEANLREADGLRAEFVDCRFEGAHWDGSDLPGAAFRESPVNLTGARLHRTRGFWPEAAAAAWQQQEFAPMGHLGGVNAVAWSPDGRRALSASDDKSLRIWDASSGDTLLTLSGHSASVYDCAWSPDGRHILSASLDQSLRIWDASSGDPLLTLSGHSDSVRGCAWSPDRRRVLSASADKSLRIWDASSGDPLLTLSGHSDSVRGCAWSPDGRRVLSASADNSLRIWDAYSGDQILTLSGHSASVWGCAWSPDGRRVVSTSRDRSLRIWDASSGDPLLTLSDNSDFVRGCAWSPDGRSVLSASDDNSLCIWDASSGDPRLTFSGHSDWLKGCAWSPDGRRVLSASGDNSLRIWDASSGDRLLTLSGHSSFVLCCAWSPDGRRVLSASYDKSLRIWDASSGDPLLTLSGHSASVNGCAWSPDGRRILSASDDKSLRIWDASSGDALLTLSGHSDYVRGCAWSPDGRRVLSASADDSLRIWDACSGDPLLTLSGHSDSVTSCAWSPDGRQILSASADGSLRTWDAESGVEIHRHLHFPEGETATIDPHTHTVLHQSENAWRYLKWVVRNRETGAKDIFPDEVFHP